MLIMKGATLKAKKIIETELGTGAIMCEEHYFNPESVNDIYYLTLNIEVAVYYGGDMKSVTLTNGKDVAVVKLKEFSSIVIE